MKPGIKQHVILANNNTVLSRITKYFSNPISPLPKNQPPC